jgi:hypothetical protein
MSTKVSPASRRARASARWWGVSFGLRPITTCAYRKSKPDILVVQPAENWAAKNLPGPFDGTRERRIFSKERCVRAPL